MIIGGKDFVTGGLHYHDLEQLTILEQCLTLEFWAALFTTGLKRHRAQKKKNLPNSHNYSLEGISTLALTTVSIPPEFMEGESHAVPLPDNHSKANDEPTNNAHQVASFNDFK
ncbi:hypothetical protein ACH5RR_012497 [Cinchona calisaya]|uniref:Uncharacterized protein n=1 Tax=Cinchona calisaya TaxID=153742 RepID=A0ABD3A7W4_9GENT